jgi:hypothetical protein
MIGFVEACGDHAILVLFSDRQPVECTLPRGHKGWHSRRIDDEVWVSDHGEESSPTLRSNRCVVASWTGERLE